ncbi:MAG: TonB family protein [Rhodocyclales bacterium]|nr:TonB family protein [Rhodocyclales bacterium]
MDAAPRWLLPAVLALHAGLLLALTRGVSVPPSVPPVPLAVELLAPPPAVPTPVRPVLPRPQPPRPVARSVPAPMPQPAPTPASTPAAIGAAPTPVPVPVAANSAPAPQPAPAAPAPTPPRFDAAYLNNPAPAYPALARRMGEQGRVLVRVRVSPEGDAEQVELKQGSGSPRLDQAAVEAVRRWRFVPARQGTEAVAAWVLVPISFNLES